MPRGGFPRSHKHRLWCSTHLMMPRSATSDCTGFKLTESGFPIVKLSPRYSLYSEHARVQRVCQENVERPPKVQPLC